MADERRDKSAREREIRGKGPAPRRASAQQAPSPSPPRATDQPAAVEPHEEERVERDLSELLSDVKRERDEYLELAKRTKADFENYRKRVASEATLAEKRGRAQLARDLVPALDN